MRIALFLGAGASVPYGMPTTAGLRDKMQSAGAIPPLEGMQDPVEFPDVEHTLSVVDRMIDFAESRAGRLYAKHDTTGTFNTCVSKSRLFKKALEDIISASYKWNPRREQAAVKVLKPLFDLARSEEDQSVTIFTTNFDTVIEEYCASTDSRIDRIDGFNRHPPSDIHAWDGKYVAKDEGAHTWVFLYKLHGSMSWLKRDLDGIPSIVQKSDTRGSGDPIHDMFIRPSLDVKDESTAVAPYAAIKTKFDELLPSFDACVVIGYSFRDKRISKKLVDFVKSGKTLVAVSPTAAADFNEHALGKPLSTVQKHDWKDRTLCYMKYLSETGTGHFYAVHEKLENVDVPYLKLVIQNQRTPHHLGLILPAS